MVSKKLKFAFVSLTSCEGCYVELLNLHEKFVELKDKIEIVEFRLFEDDNFFSAEKLDVVFVEGSPVTKENIENLNKIRKKTKFLVACGSCACIGGIYQMKNYYNKESLMENIYKKNKKLDNPKIFPISYYVSVDHELPTCPVVKEEMLNFIYAIIKGKKPVVHQNPVCYQCASNGYECLLQKGEICLGPIIQGGCDAICLKSKQACQGCRGVLKKPQIENWKKVLNEKGFSNEEIDQVLKIFGVKNLIVE
jgi:sulfhydrogenase subunit delta